MDTIQIILEIVILLSIIFVGFVGRLWIKNYFPSYFNEKGKNLATKEDIADITAEVERVRSFYASDLEKLKNSMQLDLERLKFDIQKISQVETKKREVYHDIVKSMGIFISGRPATEEQKERFLDDYSTMWLWAPDSVVRLIQDFLDLQMAVARKPGSIDQETLKRAYTCCVIEMRRDSGFSDTMLSDDDYRFVYF